MIRQASIIHGFPPIAADDAQVLILGSMPSEESLRLQQYYAHPRNGFWPIMQHLFAQDEDLDYARRAQLLIENRIALWDTLKSCVRDGSLDSAIVDASVATNDFAGFFRKHPGITTIFFNGQKSRLVYQKKVAPGLPEKYQHIRTRALPSTSPAMASLNRKQKVAKWSVILDALADDSA